MIHNHHTNDEHRYSNTCTTLQFTFEPHFSAKGIVNTEGSVSNCCSTTFDILTPMLPRSRILAILKRRLTRDLYRFGVNMRRGLYRFDLNNTRRVPVAARQVFSAKLYSSHTSRSVQVTPDQSQGNTPPCRSGDMT